ncbi:MAG TPA: FHA domain-containing protein [Gemmataceae bacterium]|nr:FHA domain-containing protein [Gemmataceae bacterium]
MYKKREVSIKPGQAALFVTYGNTTRKCHPLEGDLVVLGRAPTCDISLGSPEVAPVHCILLRTSGGWRLRDCSGGRHATRLNGRQFREEALHDSDVLQIGAFSFEMHLPSERPTPVIGSTPVVDERLTARLNSLQRSRRNLVRLALRLRRKAHRATALPPTLAELEQQSESLRGLQRDYQALLKEYEARLNQLERAERELCDERAEFELACIEHRIRLEKAEHEMARQHIEQLAVRSGMRQGSVRDRLAELPHLKQELAGTSPSAPGEQLRLGSQQLTADPAPSPAG